MKYRSVSISEATEIRKLALMNELTEVGNIGHEVGDGDMFLLDDLIVLGREASAQCEKGVDPEIVEGDFSANLYQLLRSVPVSIRDDSGFWRWVTIACLFPFLKLRENPIGKEIIGAGDNEKDILARRMFLRAQVSKIVEEDGTLSFDVLSSFGVKKNHDFWQSHIVRMSTGAENALAQALIKSQVKSRINTKLVRPFVRDLINRPKGTIATFLMTPSEAAEYIDDQKDGFTFEPDNQSDA
jgi:hypothetical protein